MNTTPFTPDPSPQRGDCFATTRWTVVLHAGRKSSPQSDHALGELCQTYWYPLYAYVRRQGHTKEDSEDLVQAFFEKFLEKNYLEGLSAERGKFRAFLLASLKHFLANEWDKSQRQKRGGGVQHLSLDWQSADERFHLDPPDPSSPDKIFDREWALALLERVVIRLRDECAAEGKAKLFEHAKGYLMVGEKMIPYADAARQLGLDEGAVRVAVHRLRKRYRELLRDEIAQTLDDPAQVAEELRSLQAALAS
ncbi:MAG: sigma-70 family RNA polymerase sigma factor [Verrucomicrobia bacterium]|nr:sigma-70 family RNA polymerase sigma factor [Verrucomicrobiota bacterium]